jgi:hypothetical protein
VGIERLVNCFGMFSRLAGNNITIRTEPLFVFIFGGEKSHAANDDEAQCEKGVAKEAC